MTDADRDTEIRQLEDDLRNLQRRYVHLERSARWTRIALYIFLGVMVCLVLAAAILGEVILPVMITIVLIVMCAAAYTLREQRLIDTISWIGWDSWQIPTRSEAMAIEDMVAERTARLSALKESK